MKSVIIISCIIVQAFNGCRNNTDHGNYSDRRIKIIPDSPYIISAVINDADDPVSLLGVDFTIGEDVPPIGNLLVFASSSNTSVVPNTNLALSGSGATRNLKIKAIAPGYSTITVSVINGARCSSYVLNYAASHTTAASGKRWHTGISDASAAIVADEDYMIVANDETNYLYLYHRNHSGLPVKSFDFNQNNILGLTDSSTGKWKEVDVEGAVRSIRDPSVIYWIGSMSNNSSFMDKPNRNKLFAVTVSGKGTATTLSNAGHYSNLRQRLILWGDAHGYEFANSASAGKNPKMIDGFNIEGMVFGPDNKTLYIGFRAPLVPTGNRTKAVIAPVQNFESWFNNGSQTVNPTIGSPIELDLGGRGIRDIIRLPNGNYVVIAGSCDAEVTPGIYSWTGYATDTPEKLNSLALANLNAEGVMPVYEGGQLSLNKLQLVTDNGNDIYYGDTVSAKNLSARNFKKFSSVITESPKKLVLPLMFSKLYTPSVNNK